MNVRLLGGVEGRSSNIASESCINLYYEKTEYGESLVNTSGASVFATLTGGQLRGGIEYDGKAWFVCSNTLYEITSGGVATSRGAIGTSTGRVSMAHNGTRAGANQQIMIVDGSSGYIYNNVTSTLTEISDVDFTNTEFVVFIDGYFIFAQLDSDRIWLTSLYDGTAIDSADFSTAEGDPDKILSIIADQRELFVFGEKTIEIWYNSGDADNTFQRYQGGFKQTGTAAKHSPARVDNNIYWLTRNEKGHGQIAMMGADYQPQIVSSPALDYQISTYATIDDAFGYAYQHQGHEFYVITFPSEQATWAYDASTKRWHRRGHTIDGLFPNRERYNCHVFAFGKHLFGDMDNGKVYALDDTVQTFAGDRIPRQLTTPTISDEGRRIRLSEAQLDMQEGTGDPNSSTDTSIWLSYSKDGGHTYGNEIERDIGDAGYYGQRVVWRKLGKARDWTFKIRTWTPNKVILKGLYLRPYGT